MHLERIHTQQRRGNGPCVAARMNNHSAHFRLILIVLIKASSAFPVLTLQRPGSGGGLWGGKDGVLRLGAFTSLILLTSAEENVMRLLTPDLTLLCLTHIVHKMTKIVTGRDSGELVCEDKTQNC